MNGEQNAKRNNIGKKAGIIGIVINLLLAISKLAVGILSASASVIADALNNFTDGVSSVVAFIGFKLSQKPADVDHPFGHARYEYVSSFIVSLLIVMVGFELAKSSIEKIISPESIVFSSVTVIVLAVSMVAKFSLSIYNDKMAKKLNSSVLKATATDCRNDVIMTSVVLIALIFEHLTSFNIDGYVGLAVSIFIFISGISLVKETSSPILGNRNDDKLKNIILEKIKEYPIVIGYHDLIIHDYGPGISFCSIHFEIDKNHDPLYVHEIIDKFEREINQYGTSLTVHYDPVVTDDEQLNLLRHALISALTSRDNRLSFHDLRSIPCDGFTKIFLDVALPPNLENQKQEISVLIEDCANSLSSTVYQAEITFDSDAFN